MADITVADVLIAAQSKLGDASGEITQEIVDDFETAYGDLLSLLMKIAAPEIQREVYDTLPANTNVVFPSQLGVVDFGEPQQVWARAGISTSAISNVQDGTPIAITVSGPLPSPSDGRVELQDIPGVPGWVNRDWFITATGANSFTLNGSVTTGIGGSLATSGTVGWSSERFQKLQSPDVAPFSSTVTPSIPISWKWQEGNLYLNSGANQPIQLWIEYLANSTPPTSGVIGLCDGREKEFLAFATAANFAPKRQMVQGPALMARAYGPTGEPDGSGGLLRALVVPILKQKQITPRRAGTFRLRRGLLVIV